MNDQPDDLEALLHRSFRYALSLVHNQDLAQDLVQEACVKISRNNGPWHIGYIITTIRHCYIDQYHRGKHIQVESINTRDLVGEEDVPHPLDPELASALQQLRPDERELLYLSAVEEYSANEIAKLTHKPRGTILSILHRTKKKLRQILAKEETGHTDERTA
jgi:RNA polymerase sigma-70 factor (ECF subfamily)